MKIAFLALLSLLLHPHNSPASSSRSIDTLSYLPPTNKGSISRQYLTGQRRFNTYISVELKDFLGKSYDSCSFQNLAIDSHPLKGTKFTRCYFYDNDYTSHQSLDIAGAEFVECEIPLLTIQNPIACSDLVFRNCNIAKINLFSLQNAKRIRFLNSRIHELRLSNCSIEFLVIESGTIDTVLAENCTLINTRIDAPVSHVIIEEGICDRLSFSNKDYSKTELILRGVALSLPDIPVEIIQHTDFTRARISAVSFMTLQHFEAETLDYGEPRREIYQTSRVAYSILRKQFQDIGMGTEARWMEYQMHLAEYKSKTPDLFDRIAFYWNDQIRGHFGLDAYVGLRSFVVIWLLFALFYCSMGVLNIAWGAVIYTNSSGDPLSTLQPVILTGKSDYTITSYLAACIIFSLDQMLVAGVRKGNISYISETFMSVPQRFIGIGYGRVVAGLENFVGLILIFYFIQAIVKAI